MLGIFFPQQVRAIPRNRAQAQECILPAGGRLPVVNTSRRVPKDHTDFLSWGEVVSPEGSSSCTPEEK